MGSSVGEAQARACFWGGSLQIGWMGLGVSRRRPSGRSARWLFAGASAFAAETPARAGFLQPEGVTQVISSGAASRFSRQFDAKGRLRRAETFSKASLETYIERGFNGRFMGIMRGGTEQLTLDVIDDANGIQQARFIEAGGRLFVGDYGGVRVSGQLLAGWRGCACGSQVLTADARAIFAMPFQLGGIDAYAEAQAGYRHGGRVERSEFRFDVTLGARLRPDILLLAQVFAATAQREGDIRAASRVKAELGLVWDFNRYWSLQVGAFTTLVGRNTGHETGGRIALWRRFTPPPAKSGS
jgi:hypothetical protein